MTAAPAWQEAAVHRFPATGADIRTVCIDDEVWLVAMDLCRVLEIGRTHDAVRGLDADEKGTASIRTPGGDQQVSIVSESGFYALVLRSRKPEAKAFKRWVTHDVLPSIRRVGSYGSAPDRAPAIDSPEEILALAAAFHDAARRLVGAQQRVAELEPGAEAWAALGEAAGDYSLREAALILTRDHGIEIGQNRLMRHLRDAEMVDERGRPYAAHNAHLVARPTSYTHPHSGEPVLTHQVRVTFAGIKYLRKRLGGTGKPAA